MESCSPRDGFLVPSITISDTEEPGYSCVIFSDPAGTLRDTENDLTPTMETTKALSKDGNQNTAFLSPTDETKKLEESILAQAMLSDSESEMELDMIAVAEVVKANEPKLELKRARNKENDKYVAKSTVDAIHYRINFRCRNRVPSDAIYVDKTTPAEELARDPIGRLEKNEHGKTVALTFQFRHILKETTYKNKYIIQIDDHKLKFSERDDSVLIRRGGDATLLMGTSNNKLYRNRNMAMEELRNMLNMNLEVSKALFMSTNADQMGQVNLLDFVDSVSVTSLNVFMDSYPDVVQFIKLCKTPIFKLVVMCQDDFEDFTDLKQVRTATNLKLTGRSNISDEGLLSLEANSFEFQSHKITTEGLNAFVKTKLASGIADDFLAVINCYRGSWEPEEVLEGLEYVEYKNKDTFRAKNGPLPLNWSSGILACINTKAGEKIVVVISDYHFEMYKEELKPRMLTRDFNDCEY